MKKFELTSEFVTFLGKKLFRIKALISFGNVEEGELGGYVEKKRTLAMMAMLGCSAMLGCTAMLRCTAMLGVSGNALVCGNAEVCGDARVYGDAEVYGNAWVSGNALVCGNAEVCGDARVYGDADYATVHGFGSEYRTTTFFRTKAGDIGVRCGCFYGTLEEFRAKVKETHGETKTAKEYLMVADLMEFRFSKEEA